MIYESDWEITADSFGSECPTNWAEIADFLNDKIRPRYEQLLEVYEKYDADEAEYADVEAAERAFRDFTDWLWENYLNEYPDAPEGIMNEEEEES